MFWFRNTVLPKIYIFLNKIIWPSWKKMRFLLNIGSNCMKGDHPKIIFFVICRCDSSAKAYLLINYLIMEGWYMKDLYRCCPIRSNCMSFKYAYTRLLYPIIIFPLAILMIIASKVLFDPTFYDDWNTFIVIHCNLIDSVHTEGCFTAKITQTCFILPMLYDI